MDGMPELPEVETVRSQLQERIADRTITDVTLRRPDLRWPIPIDLHDRLTGAKITSIVRHGKYLFILTDKPDGLGAHLGMSGSFRTVDKGDNAEFGKHDHAVITFKDGGKLVFNDPRRFGALFLTSSADWRQDKQLANKGPDPVTEKITAEWFHGQLQKRKTPIKVALLDQGLLSGVGNIYASEALFMAKIKPARPAQDLTKKQAGMLLDAIHAVLAKAIAFKGSTLRNYAHIDGGVGGFQNEFLVYGQAGKTCPVCHSSIIVKSVQAGRATYSCPKCQK